MKRLAVALALFGVASAQVPGKPSDQSTPSPFDPGALPHAIFISSSNDGSRFVGPLVERYVLRLDRGMAVAPTVDVGDVVLIASVNYARTARLLEEIRFRGRRRGDETVLPAGLPFYRVDDIEPTLPSPGYTPVLISAWCTPEPSWQDGAGLGAGPLCLVRNEGTLGWVALSPTGHPLAPQTFHYSSGRFMRRPALEEAPVEIPGEMTARIEFLGRQDRNLAVRMLIRSHIEGRADVVQIISQEAPIIRDGSAYFPMGGSSTIQLQPITGSPAYRVRFNGSFAIWFERRRAAVGTSSPRNE